MNPDTGKSWGPRGVNAYGSAIDSLNKLIAEKGEKGAVDWLLNEHPVKELRDYMTEGQSPVAGKATDMVPGAMILGAKRGPFMQNLHGIESKFTADMWVARTWNRWMGTLDLDPEIGDKGKVSAESDAPRNDSERKLMRESFEKTANKLGLSTSSLQAVLWYYEQALYRAHGVPVESWSFADAAKRVRDEYNPAQAEMFPYGESEQKGGLEALQAPETKVPGAVNALDFLRMTKQSKVNYATPKGWNQFGPTATPGLVKQGNIDLTTRPIVKNDDGTTSSEYSTSFDDGKGHEVLVPTVVNGKFLTPDGKKPKTGSPEEKAMFERAWQHYEQTGEHLGMFDNAEHADLAASRIHNRPKK